MNADWLDCLALLSKQCFKIVQDLPSVYEQRLKLRKVFVTFDPPTARQCLFILKQVNMNISIKFDLH
ncbi:hypothetical protein [Acinetobacter venetianus]|uniref:hypothetical protein n=1 Tax=Acinetobacter venetianus TaxID=52133 RepID=UPI003EF39F8F